MHGSLRTLCLLIGLALGCESTNEASVDRAREHTARLVEISKRDVAEVREGLPQGAAELAKIWADGPDLLAEPEAAARALERARDRVQSLRVAKSTFFALANTEGLIVRNDREQDSMAGKSLFPVFPALTAAASGAYVETLGAMPEAHGVKGRPDAEWISAVPVRMGEQIKGVYVTGWSWSAYARGLEFSLRGQVEAELEGARVNVPLLYVFVIVERQAFGSPESPEVNAAAIAERDPLAHLDARGTYGALLEITGRTFALAVRSAPDLGSRVGIAVLRSET